MKRIIFFFLALAPVCLPLEQLLAQAPFVSNNKFISVDTNGQALLSQDTTQRHSDIAQPNSSAVFSPYAPKAQVYNDKNAAIKVSMTEEPMPNGTKGNQKWFFEIPDSIIGRMMLAITRLTDSPPGFYVHPHQEMAEGMYSFTLSPDKKNILLKDCSSTFVCDTTDAISKAVDLSNCFPIVACFKIDTFINGVYKINVNGLVLNDNFMTVHRDVKATYSIQALDYSRSMVSSIHAYPTNIELRTTRTYITSRFAEGFCTIGINTSLILLPKEPMQKRLSDPRMGFNTIEATCFSDNQQKVENCSYITRWRLEPKTSEDAQRQLNGELIEPKKPIVYYIDPAFPEKWVPYVKQGVAQWQRAFEKAGWKNAIYALEWPTTDSTMSMEDARYNVIRMVAMNRGMVFGADRAYDYRSGEFVNSFIYFYQGALEPMRCNYVASCGATDPESHSAKFPDELMGALISSSIAKAVAPTIGLANNMLASTLSPTDSLRSKTFLQKYSLAPSITDELPYNYVAQPEDGLTRDELIPRVSDGDEWTIELGYKPLPYTNPEQERQYLQDYITLNLTSNPRLEFASSSGVNDPFCKANDLGDDQIKAVRYGLKNLKSIANDITSWGATVKDFQYSSLNQLNYMVGINEQISNFHVIIANNITGTRYRKKPAGVDGPVWSYTSKESVDNAIDLMIELFEERIKWLYTKDTHRFSPALPDRVGLEFAPLLASQTFSPIINHLNPNVNKIDFMQRIFDACLNHASPGEAPDLYNRIKQNSFVRQLIQNFSTVFSSNIDVEEKPLCRYFLRKAQSKFKAALPASPDQTTRDHYDMLLSMIDDFFAIK